MTVGSLPRAGAGFGLGFAQDFRYALRSLRRSRGFAAAAVLTLAAGIGGNTAIFQVVHGVAFRPLPFPDPKRLVRLYDAVQAPGGETYRGNVYPGRWTAIVKSARSFERVTAARPESLTWSGGEVPAPLEATSVSAGTFDLFGIRPVAGRLFTAEEESQGRQSGVAVISRRLWVERLAGDPGAIGRPLPFAESRPLLVGVLPDGFHFPYRADVWLPLSVDAADRHDLLTIARLSRGVSIDAARAEMDAVARALDSETPGTRGRKIDVMGLKDDLVRDEQRVPFALMTAVGFLLLLACVNLASLLLARSVARQKEMAIRAALGATRGRLARQLLAESVVLSLAGGALGLLAAHLAAPALASLVPQVLSEELAFAAPRWEPAVLLFGAGLSLATGLAFGLLPAWLGSRSIGGALRRGGRSTGAGTSGPKRTLAGMVIGEVALATVLMAGAATMLGNLARIESADLGLHAPGLLAVELPLPESRYAEDGRRQRAVAEVLRQLRSLPGVAAAEASTINPLGGATWGIGIGAAEAGGDPGRTLPSVNLRLVTPGLRKALGTPLLAGRDLADGDGAGTPEVAIVSRSLARRLWPGRSAVGQSIVRREGSGRLVALEVVGVAGDVRDAGELRDAVYLPYAQHVALSAGEPIQVMVRTVGARGEDGANPEARARDIRKAVARIDAALAPSEIASMERVYARSLSQSRLGTSLLSGFAAFGFCLAALGILGVVSFTTGLRRSEIGVRMAVGASPRQIRALVVRQGLTLGILGAALGLPLSFAANRILAGFFPRFSESYSAPFAVALVLTAVAAFASDLPARRAARLDPASILQGG